MTGRIAIYTCIIGRYDELRQPFPAPDGFDFICFVGKGEAHAERDGVWEIRELPVSLGNATLDSRWPKMHPHSLLPEYEFSVWIDGNIEILDSTLYDAALRKAEEGRMYCGVPHPSRDCVYEEAKKCRDMRYISYFKLAVIWISLFLGGVKRHAGLLENNLIFRRHLAPEIVALDEMWWDKVLHFCRRDQLSLGLCMKRSGISPDLFLPNGGNTRNCAGFKYLLHK